MAIFGSNRIVLNLPLNGLSSKNPESGKGVSGHLSARTKRLLVVLAGVIVAMALPGTAILGSAMAAPPSAGPELDHFRCYSVTVGHPANVSSVVLIDQFDERLNTEDEFWVGQPIGFCPPVEKTVPGPGQDETTEILDRDHHLTMYEIYSVEPKRRPTWNVKVDNQFGRQTLFASKPVLLGVPTWKVSFDGNEPDPPHNEPEGLNHFKCYRAKGQSVNVAATLSDEEFETTEVIVREPLFFCNPTVKLTPPRDSETTEIEDEDAHLTCYDIDLATQIGVSSQHIVGTVNQFNHIPVEPLSVVTDERVLCVPSIKTGVLGTPGSFTARN